MNKTVVNKKMGKKKNTEPDPLPPHRSNCGAPKKNGAARNSAAQKQKVGRPSIITCFQLLSWGGSADALTRKRPVHGSDVGELRLGGIKNFPCSVVLWRLRGQHGVNLFWFLSFRHVKHF